jgi:hypothetical protein
MAETTALLARTPEPWRAYLGILLRREDPAAITG